MPWWPVAVFVLVLAIVAIIFAARQIAHRNGASPSATPSPTTVGGGATAPASATMAAGPGGATNTPGARAGIAPTATVQPPTNPLALHVASGSCTVHRITWTWSGARRATSYEVVLYDPSSGATIKDTAITGTSYTLPAGPGATVALKVRSRNAGGTGRGYFTPGSVGHVPSKTTNPTHLALDVRG